MSLPSRERGLKYGRTAGNYVKRLVAPLAGAWIEISGSLRVMPIYTVAPLAGAWIEIKYHKAAGNGGRSLPSRERGLKLSSQQNTKEITRSLPSRERGLKC